MQPGTLPSFGGRHLGSKVGSQEWVHWRLEHELGLVAGLGLQLELEPLA